MHARSMGRKGRDGEMAPCTHYLFIVSLPSTFEAAVLGELSDAMNQKRLKEVTELKIAVVVKRKEEDEEKEEEEAAFRYNIVVGAIAISE